MGDLYFNIAESFVAPDKSTKLNDKTAEITNNAFLNPRSINGFAVRTVCPYMTRYGGGNGVEQPRKGSLEMLHVGVYVALMSRQVVTS